MNNLTRTSYPYSLKQKNAIESKPPKPLLSLPVAIFGGLLAGGFSYLGAIQRPALVPFPFIAAVVIAICFFFLLMPFTRIPRTLWGFISPESMGGIGYLIYIGVAAVTNHMWPGLAVNPSLFGYLPAAILAQTAGAMAYFIGTQVARQWGRHSTVRTTNAGKLAILLSVYALFALYLLAFTPRVDAGVLLRMIRSGDSLPWIFTVGQFIVLQSLPMIIAAWAYLRSFHHTLFRYVVIAVLGFSILLFLLSGSRTYAVQVVLMLFIAGLIANKKFSKRMMGIVIVIVVGLLILSTRSRLVGNKYVSFNPVTEDFISLNERAYLMTSSSSNTTPGEILANINENLVYHLSDNQTMAMLMRNYDRGPLFGGAALSSLLSGLPSGMRPEGYISGTNLIVRHFQFYKERTTDAYYVPDWQISLGAMGFADFWLFGLLLYPLFLGIILRWIYNRTVVTQGFGEAGWLLYVPLIQMMWNPLLFGPDSTQTLRLLIPLAIGLLWATNGKSRKRGSRLARGEVRRF